MLNCKAFKTYFMLQNIMKSTKSQNSSKHNTFPKVYLWSDFGS